MKYIRKTHALTPLESLIIIDYNINGKRFYEIPIINFDFYLHTSICY